MQRAFPRLATVLAADAAGCLGLGLAALAAPGSVATLTGLPRSLVAAAGAVLLAVAAVLMAAALRRGRSRPLLRLVLACNVAWLAASVATLALIPMTPFGVAAVVAQAAVVAGFALVEAKPLMAQPADGAA